MRPGGMTGTYCRTAAFSPVPSWQRKSPEPAPPAAEPLRFPLLVNLAAAVGNPGRSGREGSGCRDGGAEWHGSQLIGAGLDRPAVLRRRQGAGRIAAGIHGTKGQDAEGGRRMAVGLAAMWDFRSWERLAENDGGEGRFGGMTDSCPSGRPEGPAVAAAGFSHERGGSRTQGGALAPLTAQSTRRIICRSETG